MDYSVKLTFDCLEALLGEHVLASFRGNNPEEGWSIRYANGIVQVHGVQGYQWINARLELKLDANELEWQIFGPRHLLVSNGLPVAECVSALSLPLDGQLHVGTDPHGSANPWPYRISVEI